ncbi:MAG: ABC transporter ATP-binding protein [candidate division Zixibacteria bacterium]|nr:ABC transporter ATP-binding protein [candidate division Zixibacteria bacterium]
MTETLVQVRNVSKSYYRDSLEIPVLRNISFDIPAGQFLALMGPSGSGKTTLLNLISGIDQPTAGDLMVAGENIARLSQGQLAKWRSQHIGLVFQFYNLLPVLTAYENVELPLLLYKLSKADRRKRVETALSIVGLGDRMDHYPRQLSGGQEQRVAIARAIVADPTLLLADEPTGDLDKASAEEIMTLLTRLNKEFNKTIIMVTHDPRAADKASLIRNLDKGELA